MRKGININECFTAWLLIHIVLVLRAGEVDNYSSSYLATQERVSLGHNEWFKGKLDKTENKHGCYVDLQSDDD